MVDFTVPDTVFANARQALSAGVHVVVGTTGLTDDQVGELRELAEGGRANALIAPNFAVGAVLLMRFAAEASRHMAKAEIIELHHDRKLDAPSGTALRTAALMQGDPVIHSVRLPGPRGAPGGDPRRARRDADHPPRLPLARELHAGRGAGRARRAEQAGSDAGARAGPLRRRMSPPPASRRIRKLLVANRSEIAIRVFRAATELGLRTVAIYSLEDRFALHRFKADEAYQVGRGAEPVRAYLDIDDIMRVAREAGVDAIHPGYGFLAENPDLALACARENICWIGPPREVMERLGNKVEARALAGRAGVPVMPATGALPDDPAEVRRLAEDVGFPLMVKASWGGGGRGMRMVHDPAGARASRSTPRAARRRPRSATARSSSSGWSSGPGTSRSRCSPTSTAAWSTSTSATARCSGATRRWSRSPRRRASTRPCATRSAPPPCA